MAPSFISGGIEMHKINGILIDPEERTVTDVEVGYSLEEWYKLLDCEYVESTPIMSTQIAA